MSMLAGPTFNAFSSTIERSNPFTSSGTRHLREAPLPSLSKSSFAG
jgi:hypothetical protein